MGNLASSPCLKFPKQLFINLPDAFLKVSLANNKATTDQAIAMIVETALTFDDRIHEVVLGFFFGALALPTGPRLIFKEILILWMTFVLGD